MFHLLAFLYGIVSYLLFVVSLGYAIGFIGNILVPKSIDAGPSAPFVRALLLNTLLISLFAVQHSVMARPRFKKWWTRIVPAPVERSTYVLFSSLALLLLFWQWQPMPRIIWDVQNLAGRVMLISLFWLGWATMLIGTFLISHVDLFGLRQVYLHDRGLPYRPPAFRVRFLHRIVRHPINLGFLVAFWSTPRMTVGHLLFALLNTAYILIAVRLEERDLVEAHGDVYKVYQRDVPALVPRPGTNWVSRVLSPVLVRFARRAPR